MLANMSKVSTPNENNNMQLLIIFFFFFKQKTAYEIDRERQGCVAEILAEQLQRVSRDVERAGGRHQQVQQRHREADDEDHRHHDAHIAIQAVPEKTRDHSTDLPFSANSPRGRRWMNRLMNTSTRSSPSTAPA